MSKRFDITTDAENKSKFIDKINNVKAEITPKDTDFLQRLKPDDVIAIVYAKAIWDVRNELAKHLIELDPDHKRERLMRRIDEIIKDTPFEGLSV